MPKRAFVTCQHCGEDILAMIQISEQSAKTAQLSGNTQTCPNCRKQTSADNLKWKEIPL